MYNIFTSIMVKAPREVIFSVLKDMPNFPQFMHYVKKVECEKISNQERISRWNIDVEGADVAWEEKDTYDDKKMELSFTKIQGDYNSYYGKWCLKKEGDRTRLSIDVNVDWDIPSFEKVIGPILKEKTKRIVRGMLAAVKLQSEKLNNANNKKVI